MQAFVQLEQLPVPEALGVASRIPAAYAGVTRRALVNVSKNARMNKQKMGEKLTYCRSLYPLQIEVN